MTEPQQGQKADKKRLMTNLTTGEKILYIHDAPRTKEELMGELIVLAEFVREWNTSDEAATPAQYVVVKKYNHVSTPNDPIHLTVAVANENTWPRRRVSATTHVYAVNGRPQDGLQNYTTQGRSKNLTEQEQVGVTVAMNNDFGTLGEKWDERFRQEAAGGSAGQQEAGGSRKRTRRKRKRARASLRDGAGDKEAESSGMGLGDEGKEKKRRKRR